MHQATESKEGPGTKTIHHPGVSSSGWLNDDRQFFSRRMATATTNPSTKAKPQWEGNKPFIRVFHRFSTDFLRGKLLPRSIVKNAECDDARAAPPGAAG